MLFLAWAQAAHMKVANPGFDYSAGGRIGHTTRDNTAAESDSWPYGPFSTKGRDIVNTRGEIIQWAGVNWPGHRKEP